MGGICAHRLPFHRKIMQQNSPHFVQALWVPLNRVHRDEAGNLSILSLVVVLMLVIVMCAIVNTMAVVRNKLECQNSSDAVAYASSTQMARGMNAITASNHIIGELQALVVLHHALGGDALDDGSSQDHTPGEVRGQEDEGYQLARDWTWHMGRAWMPKQRLHDRVDGRIEVEASLRDAKAHLKKTITYAYVAHAVGGFLNYLSYVPIPYVNVAINYSSKAIIVAAFVIEGKVALEYVLLDIIELTAKLAKYPKLLVKNVGIPGVYGYSILQANSVPYQMERTAEEMASRHQAKGWLYPGLTVSPSWPLLQLPVAREKETMTKEQLERSQLVRASTPWIQHWRLPLLGLGDRALRLSRFKDYYVKYSQDFTLEMADRAKREQFVNLYIIDEFDNLTEQKGDEQWAQARGSREADELFAIIGFSYREKPRIAAPVYFSAPNQHGFVTYSQAMIYNANPQFGNVAESYQSIVGWDTLNWVDQPVPEWQTGNDPEPRLNTPVDYFASRAVQPTIRVNWQNMLTPSTRVGQSWIWRFDEGGDILRRSYLSSSAARTH